MGDMISSKVFEIITVTVIPFIIQLLKKVKLPSKVAPWVALIIAIFAVAISKMVGINADVNTVWQAILQALGIAGVSVLGYDIYKKTTTK